MPVSIFAVFVSDIMEVWLAMPPSPYRAKAGIQAVSFRWLADRTDRRELRAAMRAERTTPMEWGSRHSEAVGRLLARHGGGPAAVISGNDAAIRDLVSNLPEAFRDDRSVVEMDEAVRLAAEWVSL